MNCCMVYNHELHGLIPCIPALGELRLRPLMSELSKHINIYIQVHIQYRKAAEDNNEK